MTAVNKVSLQFEEIHRKSKFSELALTLANTGRFRAIVLTCFNLVRLKDQCTCILDAFLLNIVVIRL